MADFNFVPPPKKLTDVEKQSHQSVFFKVLIIALVFSLLPSLIVFGVSFAKKAQLDNLKAEETRLQVILDQNKEKIAKISLVKNKLQGIKYIFDSEFDYGSALKDLFSLLPPGVELKTVVIDKKGDLIAQVGANDSSVLKGLIDNLTAQSLNYKKITVGELASTKEKGYTLPISYSVPFKGKN